MTYKNFYNSPLGEIILLSDGESLTGLYFFNQKYFPCEYIKNAELKDLKIFTQTSTWLDTYFSGKVPNFITQMKFSNSSSFRKKVWSILLNIPYGQTITYGQIAKLIEKQNNIKMSAQAVGSAVGHNPISIIIPCHRVVGKDKKLTGYAGGLDKKIKLLNLERIFDYKI